MLQPPVATLHVGNKNYSSWSLRPWLALRWSGIDFETRVVPLDEGHPVGEIPAVAAVSPTGRVPVLHLGDRRVVESLAICELAADLAPEAGLWPEDPYVRAECRAAACEMHAGFSAVRRDLPMNVRRRAEPREWPADTRADLRRIEALFEGLLETYGGPFLFGQRTIADAMYAPVGTRLRTYAVKTSPAVEAYVNTLLQDPAFLEWERDAETETWTLGETDAA